MYIKNITMFSKKSLLSYTLSFLANSDKKDVTTYLFLVFLTIITTFVPSLYIKNPLYYIITTLISIIIGYIYKMYTYRYSQKIRHMFALEACKKYESLSYRSKMLTPVNDFLRRKTDVAWGIVNTIIYSFKDFLNIIANFMAVIYIFYNNSLLFELLIMIIIHILAYYFILAKYHQQINKLRTNCHKKNAVIQNLIQIDLPRFERGERSPEHMANHDYQIESNYELTENMWNKIEFASNIINTTSIIIFTTSDEKYFLLVLMATSKFTNSISLMMNSLNTYNMNNSKYKSYLELWKDKHFNVEEKQLVLPNQLIFHVDIQQGKFRLESGSESLNIIQGDKIIINGRTGQGKTTFINALIGNIDGLILNNGALTKSYRKQMVYHVQSTKILCTHITIRQVMNDEVDDEIITRCLDIANVFDKSANVFDKSANIFSNYSYDETNIIMSGGQLQRLAIASTLQRLITTNSPILILDEPAAESDSETAVSMMQCIMDNFPNTTIIVITHLDGIKDLNWTKTFCVKDSRIFLKN